MRRFKAREISVLASCLGLMGLLVSFASESRKVKPSRECQSVKYVSSCSNGDFCSVIWDNGHFSYKVKEPKVGMVFCKNKTIDYRKVWLPKED